MKKIFLLITLVFSFLVFVACDDKDNGGEKNGEKQIIELSYADWGDQEFNQKMIDAFEEKYPHIKVTLRTDIAGSGEAFTSNLINAAQAGLLPDVFATDNVPTVVHSQLTLDVSEYWDKDEDAKLVYPNIAKTAVYNNKRFAIPSFQFFKGIAINLDIFERASLVTVEGKYRIDENGYPVKDWTYMEFVEIAKAIKNRDLDNPSAFVLGVEPWYGTMDFQQVWPTLDDADVQYDTWDGTKFNYTSDSWIRAMTEKVKMHKLNDGTIDDIKPEEIFDEDGNVIPGREYLNTWKLQTGYTAMGIHGTWNLTTLINIPKENNDTKMGFWPYPSGPAGSFPPVILDYQCVSSQTPYPEEAYLLAKWMTYGRDGWNARMDIYEENYQASIDKGELPALIDRFPVADYDDVWDRIMPYVEDVEGLPEIVSNLENSKPDLDKWLPGYKDFWAWVNDTENNAYSWEKLLAEGHNSVAAFASVWNEKINEIVSAEIASLGADN